MTKLLLLFTLLVSSATVSVFSQSHFQPKVENGIFYLYMGSNTSNVTKVEIYNDNGDLVKECDMQTNTEKTVQCQDLPSGQYYVIIHLNGEEFYSPLEIKNEG